MDKKHDNCNKNENNNDGENNDKNSENNDEIIINQTFEDYMQTDKNEEKKQCT